MRFLHSVRASRFEQTRGLPGDERISDAIASFTHAVTIRRSREEVWPWLVQMGAGRGGWYSYDFIDNGRRPSADHVVPGLQFISTGTLFPALPGVTDGFHVLEFQAHRHLVLAWRPEPDAPPMATWAFVLEEEADGSTRLIVRARGGRAYPFYGLPPSIGTPVIRFVHFIMERKQLLTLASRIESADPLLDDLLPAYDVAERHRVRVGAPPETTLAAAAAADLRQSRIVRAIFKARERLLGSKAVEPSPSQGLLAETQALGWRVLAEQPGREVVVGAVASTDAAARKKFRRYWACVSPGILLIRRMMLRGLKADVEGRR